MVKVGCLNNRTTCIPVSITTNPNLCIENSVECSRLVHLQGKLNDACFRRIKRALSARIMLAVVASAYRLVEFARRDSPRKELVHLGIAAPGKVGNEHEDDNHADRR